MSTASSFCNPRLLIRLLWIVVLGYFVFISYTVSKGYVDARSGDKPLYTDFTPQYAGSMIVRDLPAEFVYLQSSMIAAQQATAYRIYGDITHEQAAGMGFAPWMYPPTFILLSIPLAYFPYLIAWAGWLVITAVPYWMTMRYILPAPLAWPFALAAPPVFFNVMYGQTGFLTAGLVGAGLLLLRQRPVWAGILIGLASVKPHFGILIPFALAIGGHWWTFAAATLTVLSTIALSILILGVEAWFAFVGTSFFHLDGFSVGAFSLPAMTTVWSGARLAGMAASQAWMMQFITSAMVLSVVLWAWFTGRKRADTHGLQAAILCLATPLAIPMAYLYDLILIVPACAWLLADMMRRGAGRDEHAILVVCMAALLGAKLLASFTLVQIAPWVVATLLGLAMYRFVTALAECDADCRVA